MSIFWNTILTMFALSTVCACVSMTFHQFNQEPYIFQFYSKFLRTIPDWVSNEKTKNLLKWIAKPLGLCVYCNNVWVNIFSIVLLNYFGIMDLGLLLTALVLIMQASVSNVILYHIYY